MNDRIRATVKAELEKRNKSKRQFALDLDMAPQYLGGMLSGDTSNTPRRWQQVFEALDLELCLCPKSL